MCKRPRWLVPTPVSVNVLKAFAIAYPSAIAKAKALGSLSVKPLDALLMRLENHLLSRESAEKSFRSSAPANCVVAVRTLKNGGF